MFEEPTDEYIKPFAEPGFKKTSVLRKFFKVAVALVILGLCTAAALHYYVSNLNLSDESFPVYQSIVINQGSGVKEIAEILELNHVVKSADLLYYTILFFYDPTDIKASTYVFEEPITTYMVAKRLTEGDFDTDLVTLTHYEGERVSMLASRMSEVLSDFDADRFVLAAEPLEGRLFPDTYFVPNTFTDEDLLKLLLTTFSTKTESLQSQISENELTLDEILVLASIIEREANTTESMRMVSGVLQNRIAIDMPLQADASIEYVLSKPLGELLPSDLKIDSPYNTYLNLGLPPTPIGNPGLDAIEAVLNPAESDYYYYITGNGGEFYYAETYRKHLINIEKYLR